jgi:integrase
MSARLVRQQTTTWVLDGVRVPAGTPGATRRKTHLRKWYGQGIPGYPPAKRVPLSEDKRTALTMLAELVSRAERGMVGLPDAATLSTAITDHIARYSAHQSRAGSCAKHVQTTAARLRAICDSAGLVTLSDLLAPGASSRAESAIGRLPVGPVTRRYYSRDLRSFGGWLHDHEEAIPKNPFTRSVRRSRKAEASESPRRARRPLTTAELSTLLDALVRGTRLYRGLTSPARAALYATAAGTGLRRGEIASLTVGSFALGELPTVALAATAAKSGKAARLPLPPGLAVMLAEYLADRRPSEPAWPGTWHARAAEMIAADLRDAGIPYTVQSEGVTRYADFHSLRHFFTTSLVSSGASVKEAQALSRHSTPALTIGTYSHTTAPELAAAAARLPILTAQPDPSPLSGLSRESLEMLALLQAEVISALVAAHTPRHTRDSAHG